MAKSTTFMETKPQEGIYLVYVADLYVNEPLTIAKMQLYHDPPTEAFSLVPIVLRSLELHAIPVAGNQDINFDTVRKCFSLLERESFASYEYSIYK